MLTQKEIAALRAVHPGLTQKQIVALCEKHGLYVLDGQLASRLYHEGTIHPAYADAIAQAYGYADSSGLVQLLTEFGMAELRGQGYGHAWPDLWDTHCVTCHRKIKATTNYLTSRWRVKLLLEAGKPCPMCDRIYRPRKAYTKKGHRGCV